MKDEFDESFKRIFNQHHQDENVLECVGATLKHHYAFINAFVWDNLDLFLTPDDEVDGDKLLDLLVCTSNYQAAIQTKKAPDFLSELMPPKVDPKIDVEKRGWAYFIDGTIGKLEKAKNTLEQLQLTSDGDKLLAIINDFLSTPDRYIFRKFAYTANANNTKLTAFLKKIKVQPDAIQRLS